MGPSKEENIQSNQNNQNNTVNKIDEIIVREGPDSAAISSNNDVITKTQSNFGEMLGNVGMGNGLLMDDIVNDINNGGNENDDDDDVINGLTPGM